MARKRKGDTGGSLRWVRNGLRWKEGMGIIEKRNGEKSKRQEEGLMGAYLNPWNGLFKIALNSQIFVDKSRLLEVTNRCVGTMLSCNGIVLNYAFVMYNKSVSKIDIVQNTAKELPVPPVMSYFLCDCWYVSEK